MTDDPLGHFDMAIPFVACRSQGGPYDDDPFAAGFRLGLLDGLMQRGGPRRLVATVKDCEVPQLDLLCMRHGWRIAGQELFEGWVHVRVTNEAKEADDDDPIQADDVPIRMSVSRLLDEAEKMMMAGHPRPATRLASRALDWHYLTDAQMDRAADVLEWAEGADDG